MHALLALHGSSRDETDLAEFCQAIAPDAEVFASRGSFSEGAGYTYFRRRPDRSIDAKDLVSQAEHWLRTEGAQLEIHQGQVIIVGYSSGAIFGEALLSIAPNLFAGAILLRPEPISEDYTFSRMSGMRVLILAGDHDVRRHPNDGIELAGQLAKAGAAVRLIGLDCGHDWAPDEADVVRTRAWLASHWPNVGR